MPLLAPKDRLHGNVRLRQVAILVIVMTPAPGVPVLANNALARTLVGKEEPNNKFEDRHDLFDILNF